MCSSFVSLKNESSLFLDESTFLRRGVKFSKILRGVSRVLIKRGVADRFRILIFWEGEDEVKRAVKRVEVSISGWG